MPAVYDGTDVCRCGGNLSSRGRQANQTLLNHGQTRLTRRVTRKVCRQRLDKTRVAQHRGKLVGKIGPKRRRRDFHLVWQRGPPVDDRHDVFEIVAREKISSTAIVERFEFCAEEYRRGDQQDFPATRQINRFCCSDGFAVPAIAKAKNAFVGCHHIHKRTAYNPTAYGCVWTLIVFETPVLEFTLQRMIFDQRKNPDEHVHVLRCPYRRSCALCDQQSRSAAADEHEALTQRAERVNYHFKQWQVGVCRVHARRSLNSWLAS